MSQNVFNVFLDSNVILDVLLERKSKESCLFIFEAGNEGYCRLCTSVLSYANIAYVLRKYVKGEELLAMMKNLAAKVKILPMGDQTVYESLKLSGPDFEDTLQAVCADYSSCDCIVTSDKKHYRGSSVPVFTPEEFVRAVSA